MEEKSRGESSERNEDEDVISNLSVDVINSILLHLPIKDAVRTSILSTKWRYKWISIPDIVFDSDCAFKKKPLIDLVNSVDQVLLYHAGPIRKFSCSKYMQSSIHFDRWIVFLSRNGIKELVLLFSANCVRYMMPSTFFNCHELCHLELENCSFKVPQTFSGFCSLKGLYFNDVMISKDALELLLSKCPLLERLHLKVFSFGCVNIHLPNLFDINLKGSFSELSLEGSPLLAFVSIDFTFYGFEEAVLTVEDSTWMRVLGSLHKIETLKLMGKFSKFLCVPDRLPITYHHLMDLRMDINLTNSKDILSTLCICRSSPNLRKLQIKYHLNVVFEEDTEFWVEQEQIGCLFNHLKEVKMFGNFGILDLGFIAYVLANAPMLETMTIKTESSSASSVLRPCAINVALANMKMMYEERLRVFKRLMRFPRASAQAQLIYLDN